MRDAAAMAQLSAEEDPSKQEMVTLSNLRCLLSAPDECCSPPPCPPPSSTSSSASSSPRPDSHPDSPEVPCSSSSRRDEDTAYQSPPSPTPNATFASDAGSSLVQIIAAAQSDERSLSTKDNEQNEPNYSSDTSYQVASVNVKHDATLCGSSASESSETDNDDDDSVTSDASSVISREAVTWGLLSPRAPLAAAEESDEESAEKARMGKRASGAQNQVACVSAPAVTAVAEAEVVAEQEHIEVHAPRGSILSNNVVAEEALVDACSGKVSGLASGFAASVSSSLALDARGDVGQQHQQPAQAIVTPDTINKMRQKPSASGSGATSAAPSSDTSMQQEHQNSNNNAECTLQCNGMVSECCWNGDCMEARTTKNNLKPAIKLNPEKRQENGRRRVTFNETLNKFFDADYVILVGEDCNGDETTRLVSMCKKSSCQPGGNFDLNFPELCPFEPPLEYIDQVTLSPPEGYKDVLGAARGSQDDESESESSGETRSEDEDGGQSPVCEQCSSCSACASQQQQQQQQQQQRYIVETITLTTVTERRIVREASDSDEPRLSGILKGGKLWKNCENENLGSANDEGESASRRSVRFCEDEIDGKLEEDNDNSDGNLNDENEINEEPISPELEKEESASKSVITNVVSNNNKCSDDTKINEDKIVPPSKEQQHQLHEHNADNSELTLTFRLGTSVLLSDKLPPNSAVRQLFPDSEAQQRLLGVVTSPSPGDGDGKDVSESDVPSLPSPGQTCSVASSSDDEAAARTSTQIRRTIERNALRRSLLRCSEPLRRRQPVRTEDNSLVERIRQLTCDVDDDEGNKSNDNEQQANERSSPPGQGHKNQPSTYKKLTELFSRRERCHSESSPSNRSESLSLAADNSCCWLMVDPVRPPPDFSRSSVSLPPHTISPTTSLPPPGNFVGPKPAMSRMNVSAEARKQFLSTLGERETPPDGSANAGDRASVTETSYSLEDIDEALGECACPANGQVLSTQPPDVVATTQENQQRNEAVDELALFVQRDMGRIERLKKRYSLTDDDQDDYGFSRRPSVRGIKPRFGSTTEILQQIQLQLQPPALACPTRTGSHLTWPYATEPAPSSPASSPSEAPPPRRRQPGVPAPRGANGLPVLPEDSYYATVPPQDYRYLEYSAQNGSGYMYASTGNLYARNELVPYNSRAAQQSLPSCDSPPPCVVRAPIYAPHPQPQYPNQVYGTVTRRAAGAPAPVHYANGTLPHPNYVARNGGRLPAVNYAPQAHTRSDSPQRLYHRPTPTYYQSPAASVAVPTTTTRYFPSQSAYNVGPKGYPPQDLPSPSQRTLSPVPAGSPTRAANKFERGAPEGASASPGFVQDTYGARMDQVQVGNTSVNVATQAVPGPGASVAAPSPTSVYYAMNV